jgi:hypothetical protein
VRPPERFTGGLAATGRLPRPVAQAIRATHAAGVAKAAEVEAIAHVTQVALHLAGSLTTQETLLTAMTPHGQGRYRVLVDQFTAAAAGTIARMGWDY